MKRFFIMISAMLALGAAFASGCSSSDDNITDVIPTLNPTTATPTQAVTPSPELTVEPTDDPMLNPSGSPSTTGVIEDFSQGRVVEPESVPDVVSAVEKKYPKAQIQSITHALHLDEQVYEVIFTSEDGQQVTVYVTPDGSTVTESENPMATE